MSSLNTNAAFYYHWKVWYLMGIKAPKRTNKYLYGTYALIINFVVTLLFPLTLIINVFHVPNMQQLCESLTISITDTLANLKFLNVYFIREELEKIKTILRKLDKRVTNEEEIRVLTLATHTVRRLFLIFVRLYTVGIVLSVLKALFANKRILLYPAWFGVDWETGTCVYVFVITYQFFGLIVQAYQNCANDSYPPAFLIVEAAHMKALALRVERIGRLPDGSQHLFLTAEEKSRFLKEFNDCIQDHLNILGLHNIIQRIISKACLAQFLCSALVQCTVSLHFLYVVDAADYGAQILNVIFFVAITFEAFIICYFGHTMSTQSANLTFAFYSCGWLFQLPLFKRNLLITLMRTQKHAVVYAGSYIRVNLQTFLLLMKYAYSMFTLLIRLKQD